jgi:hypothetical protein
VGFVHNDLAPWNILIQSITNPIEVCYLLAGRGKVQDIVLRVKTNLIPIIIDYGKSHAIHDGMHYGFINKSSSIQDVIGILLTSLSILITRQLSQDDIKIILHLANFVTNTKYRKEPFKWLGDVKNFLSHATKYDELLYSNKHELEQRTPLNFAEWIRKVWVNPTVVKAQDADFLMDKGNARQVFDYVLANTQQKRVESFINIPLRLMKSSLPQPSSVLGLYKSAHTLSRNLASVLENLKAFDQTQSDVVFIKVGKFITDFYTNKIASTKLEKIDAVITPPVFISYDESLFSLPEKVVELLDGKLVDKADQTEYRNIALRILTAPGPFKMPDNVKNFYRDNLKELLVTPSFGSVDVRTLKETAAKVYRNNLSMSPDNDDDWDCSDWMTTTKLYAKII